MDYVRPNGSTVKQITYNEYIYNFDHLRLPPPRKPECGTSCNRKYHVVQTRPDTNRCRFPPKTGLSTTGFAFKHIF